MANVYRADQVGSLLRPPALLAARAAYAEGKLPLEALRAEEDRAVLDVLDRQRQVGVDVYSDGELRRASWLTDMAEAVEGFVPDRVELEWRAADGSSVVSTSTANVAGAKLRQHRRLTAHESQFLKAHAPGPVKMTLPCPSNFLIASYKPGVTDRFYPTRAALMADLAAIVRREIQALVDEGFAYVQLDAPYYSFFMDPRTRERLRHEGIDPEDALGDAIAGDNACLEGIPRDRVTLAMHVCRGNNRSRWYTEGDYESIAELLFQQLQVDRLLLEYDDERAGSFAPLRFVPADKTVVLGLVSTKVAALESGELVAARIAEAARYVPLERLALSPQCGFASTAPGNLLSADEQWRKLALVTEVAQQVWE